MYHLTAEHEQAPHSPYTPSPRQQQRRQQQQQQQHPPMIPAGRPSTPLAHPPRTDARRAWMVHNSDNVRNAIHSQHQPPPMPVPGVVRPVAGAGGPIPRGGGGGGEQEPVAIGGRLPDGIDSYPYHHYNHQPFVPIQSPLPPPLGDADPYGAGSGQGAPPAVRACVRARAGLFVFFF